VKFLTHDLSKWPIMTANKNTIANTRHCHKIDIDENHSIRDSYSIISVLIPSQSVQTTASLVPAKYGKVSKKEIISATIN